MKRMIRLLALLMILVLLPMTAWAAFDTDEASWNKLAKWVTSAPTTLYRFQRNYDENGEYIGYEWVVIGTLPAGKRINFLGEMEGKNDIFYWNGGRKLASIDKNAATYRDTVTIYTADGRSYSIPRPAYGDEAAVRHILSEYLGSADVQAFIDGMNQGLVGEKDENGQLVIVKMEPLAPPTITLNLAAENTPEVEMVLPGLAQSTVRLEGEETIVPTADLSWEADGAEHPLAVIYAPKSGLASLYARDEGKGGVIKKLKTGSVVLVMGQSGKYTKVYGEDMVGYVITSALNLCDPCANAEDAVLLRKANLRLAAQDNGRKLIEMPAGAVVYLIGVKGKWAQVEYEGFVGYVEKNKLER